MGSITAKVIRGLVWNSVDGSNLPNPHKNWFWNKTLWLKIFDLYIIWYEMVIVKNEANVRTTYTKYVPLVLIWCMRSYFFIGVSWVPVKLIALALLITISIPPNFSTVSSMDFWICSSFLMSTIHGNACPPAASTGKERRNCRGGNYILGTWIWSIVHGKQVLWNTTFYAYIY